MAVHGIERLDQESEEEVHGVVVLDDEVNAPALDLEGDALPGKEWEGAFGGLVVHLDGVVFHGNHVLSERRCTSPCRTSCTPLSENNLADRSINFGRALLSISTALITKKRGRSYRDRGQP